jgi:hypothetical protein
MNRLPIILLFLIAFLFIRCNTADSAYRRASVISGIHIPETLTIDSLSVSDGIADYEFTAIFSYPDSMDIDFTEQALRQHYDKPASTEKLNAPFFMNKYVEPGDTFYFFHRQEANAAGDTYVIINSSKNSIAIYAVEI